MKRNEIMATFRMLARSQGSYGRIVSQLGSLNEDDYDNVMSKLEAQNFSDAVDLIMYIEG